MGSAVTTVMDWRHRSTLVEDSFLRRLKEYGPFSRPMPDTETETSTATFRNGHLYEEEAFRKAVQDLRDLPTLVEAFYSLCTNNRDKPQIAYRPTIKVQKETVPGLSKPMEITYLGETQYIRLGDILDRVESFGRGLMALGLKDRETVSIYEETRWEWLVTIYGLWMQNLVASTVYANLGEEALLYALNETESKAIVCNGKNVPLLLSSIEKGAFPACIIVYLDALPEGLEVPKGVSLHAWQDVVELGKTKTELPVRLPTDKDATALIMYTSGTTGDPKGVIHSHDSLKSGVRIMEHFMHSILGESYDPNECYCAYLPLAHILEFGVVNVFLTRGAVVGFGSPRTITSATARPHGDFQEFRPTVVIAVPRVFDTVRRVILSKLPPVGTLKRSVFDQAYQGRLQAIKEGKDTPFYNERVFKPAREVMGGRTRIMLSGGGPTSRETQEFVNVVLGFLIIGWGLTETVCVGAIQRIGDTTPECTGQVLECEELKLLDIEDYKHTDQPEPRGEICLRGPFLFKGYYKQPELTKEALDSEGWFHTGDVGSLTPLGQLRIIGRVKALVKNSLGEYIALDVLESIYNGHPLVLNNCCCVIVHPFRNYIVLIAVSDATRIIDFAKENVLTEEEKNKPLDAEAIAARTDFRKAVGESFAALATRNNRKRFECVRYVALVQDEWTPENGMLTAAMKIKRSALAAQYKTLIDDLFTES